MTLRHLKIFVAVVEHGSATAAANTLYLAQPAVSLAIRELEEYYGIKLFDRIANRLHLTEAGKIFYSYAAHIITTFEEMENGLRNWDEIGRLRIGSSITIGNKMLPELVHDFTMLYPQIDVKVLIDSSEVIERKLMRSELDFALVEGVTHTPDLIAKAFAKDELAVVCSSHHPFATKKIITADELLKERILLREHGSGTRELFDSVMESHGYACTPSWESTSTRALLSAVVENLGIAVVPNRLIEIERTSELIQCISIKDIEFKRTFNIVYHKNKFLSKSIKEFMQLCENIK